jgi:hypothetical protein
LQPIDDRGGGGGGITGSRHRCGHRHPRDTKRNEFIEPVERHAADREGGQADLARYRS